jgi:hypothetical protein
VTRSRMIFRLAMLAGAAALAGCASAPPAQPGLADQVAALRQQVARLTAQLQGQQTGYDASITSPPPAAPRHSSARVQAAPAGDVPQSPMASPAGQSAAGPFVNVAPKNMDLPAPDPALQAAAKTYAVYLPFTDIGTLQRVDEFLDAHGITDRKDATEEGHLAIYFGVYADKRGAENRRQQISDETGLQPQIAVIGG